MLQKSTCKNRRRYRRQGALPNWATFGKLWVCKRLVRRRKLCTSNARRLLGSADAEHTDALALDFLQLGPPNPARCGRENRVGGCGSQRGAACLGSVPIFANFANFWRARSRLYQNEILQENMRLTAFFKLYKSCILLHCCNLKILRLQRCKNMQIL